MDITSKIKKLPTDPGVYLFKNKQDNLIYIGKAKNLRNRVRSYFQKNKYQTPKNQSMIKRISDLEWIVVSSEVEALFTEANLIKQHKPKYNIDLKDDKSYPFIRITNEPYPQVFLTRDIVQDGSKYFGPYTDIRYLRQILKMLHKIYQIRSCSFFMDDEIVRQQKISLCLDYHIKKCEGPCQGLVSREEYNRMIKHVIQFLHGQTQETENYLLDRMEAAAGTLRYEDAGRFRDQLKAVKSFKERQRKLTAKFENRDVFALARESEFGFVVIVRIRQGRLFSREKIPLKSQDDDNEVLRFVIGRFYLDSDFIPKEISLPLTPDDEKELLEWLRQKRQGAVHFTYPQRGEKAKEIRIAFQNAKLLLGEWILERKKRMEYIPNSLKQLQDDLQLKAPPRHIEAFDISHLGGTNTVGSMVCFIDGKSRRNMYRKFTVKTVAGIDDFAAMREVVFRRYKRVQKEKGKLPDLILVDGGKGQLSMAVSALRELGLDYIAVVGLAKRLEEVFLPGCSDSQTISKQSAGLIYLRKIRDEAHRFAIEFQRQKRTQSITDSIFKSIPGIGPKRMKTLFVEFSDIKGIAKTNYKIVSEKVRIPKKTAKEVIKAAQNFMNNK
ncbi:MAG: excinuclease ABC subunit UvrC [Candidatus Marinimicrobia bacterium]|jgi:excinuclease ABC subunit C|nr:excinuclease ABC subunit UvrC [Candidatus Neomarinimicrobiota bacterium]MDP6261369.1 excinuclease ABC subunit UvrC [Candidatus Neomarinimicrobiota bacterium]MDP7336515.1 excinuclease ABC subunit UvrC [Candidatus Neomarinimicrobiota bacterium]MDP7474410.1 excinuclease ABC subunit UvrC [Candidatus Neomarinimicrobiota bacterium]MDP7526947.1 excinuclease ABC subunit UvrC [Candidatus Neomarinimicrobiota bacterium]